MDSKSYAESLRLLAFWIEENPSIALPPSIFEVYAFNTKEDASNCLKALKPCKKEYRGTLFYLSREFGDITLKFCFYRDAVCTKRVIGTRKVEEQYIPARTIPGEVIAAHEEEIVEWDCGDPLLNKETPAVIEDEEDIPFLE